MWPFSSAAKHANDEGASTGTAAPQLAGPPAGIDLSSNAGAADQCPVDHVTRNAWLAQARQKAAAQGASTSTEQDEKTSSALAFLSAGGRIAANDGSKTTGDASSSSRTNGDGTISVNRSAPPRDLSTERVVSSIPRFGVAASRTSPDASATDGHAQADPSTSANWVYPSPAQFFSAMARKNHNPEARDMDVVVPIHNAVNERAWQQILEWERAADPQSWKTCGGPQLVSFKGRPKDVTWHAWSRSLFGYRKPFDRHDWEIDRCGRRLKYVIDFYTGHTDSGATSLSFYLDVRPSPADLEGIRMRIMRFFTRPPHSKSSSP